MVGYYRLLWALYSIAGHELGTLSIQVQNSLTVRDNFDNFSEFQNVISDENRYVRKSICTLFGLPVYNSWSKVAR